MIGQIVFHILGGVGLLMAAVNAQDQNVLGLFQQRQCVPYRPTGFPTVVPGDHHPVADGTDGGATGDYQGRTGAPHHQIGSLKLHFHHRIRLRLGLGRHQQIVTARRLGQGRQIGLLDHLTADGRSVTDSLLLELIHGNPGRLFQFLLKNRQIICGFVAPKGGGQGRNGEHGIDLGPKAQSQIQPDHGGRLHLDPIGQMDEYGFHGGLAGFGDGIKVWRWRFS